MLTVLAEPTDAVRRFRANPWPFQQSFKTPLQDLQRFIATFVAPYSLERGALKIDEVVFEPHNLLQLLSRYSIPVEDCCKFAMEAEGQEAIAELLQAVLGDWIDFLFVPIPEVFAIYADHDAFTTFYAQNDGALKSIVSALERAGFEAVPNYARGLSGDS